MFSLIACEVFRGEIERLGSLGFPFQARYLSPGLHVDFDDLKEALSSELDGCGDGEGIIVVYGECHPRMREILAPYKAARIDCQNCIDALITRKGVEDWARRGLYFYLSPGWAECWQEIFARMNWSREVARLHMGSFRGAVFLDTLGNAEEYEQELLEFFDFTLLPYEIMPVDLSHFRSLILEAKRRLED